MSRVRYSAYEQTADDFYDYVFGISLCVSKRLIVILSVAISGRVRLRGRVFGAQILITSSVLVHVAK